MARRKLTEEEILQKQKEKEQQLKEQEKVIKTFKEDTKKIIDELDNKLMLEFIKSCNDYECLEYKEVVELLIKKFSNKEFKFKAIIKYE